MLDLIKNDQSWQNLLFVLKWGDYKEEQIFAAQTLARLGMPEAIENLTTAINGTSIKDQDVLAEAKKTLEVLKKIKLYKLVPPPQQHP